jgi:hypothetical protein
VSKNTVITAPDGAKTTIVTQNRGCMWWTGTIFLALLVIGGAIAYPVLFIPIAAVLLLAGLGLLVKLRGDKPLWNRAPLRHRTNQPHWSPDKRWWWTGTEWIPAPPTTGVSD